MARQHEGNLEDNSLSTRMNRPSHFIGVLVLIHAQFCYKKIMTILTNRCFAKSFAGQGQVKITH